MNLINKLHLSIRLFGAFLFLFVSTAPALSSPYWPVVCATSNASGSENDRACLSIGFVGGTDHINLIHIDTGRNQRSVPLDQAQRGYVTMYRSEGVISKDVVLLDASGLDATGGGTFAIVILREGGLFRDDYRRFNLALLRDHEGLWRLWRKGGNWWDDWPWTKTDAAFVPIKNANIYATNPYAIDHLHFLVRRRGNKEVGIEAVILGWGGRWYETLSTDRMPLNQVAVSSANIIR
jgi:hypothetical protein